MSADSLSLDLLDTSPPPGIGEALFRASRLVSDRVGVISEVLFMETAPDEPLVYWVQSRPAELGPLSGQATLNHGFATSVDPDRATMKAVGETIERYCAAFYDQKELLSGTYEELTSRATRPEDFALFSNRQYAVSGFPFAPFTPHTPARWVRGHSLLEDCPTWVPAFSVYIPFGRAGNEPTFKDLISTGLACGTTYGSALLKALSEVVERDAYTIVWQNRLARPHIDLENVDDPLIRRLVRALQRSVFEIHAVLVTVDIPIPVILVVMTRADGPPWTVVASGADLSPRLALLLALEEACLALIGMIRAVAEAADYQPAADYKDLATLPLHGLAHAIDPRLRFSVEFLTQPSKVVRINSLPDLTTGNPVHDLRTALNQMRPFVKDVIAVDVTTADIDEVGFKVVRVVVPELQPMNINHRHPHLGGRRVYEVPWKLGLALGPADEDSLNPLPHPFP